MMSRMGGAGSQGLRGGLGDSSGPLFALPETPSSQARPVAETPTETPTEATPVAPPSEPSAVAASPVVTESKGSAEFAGVIRADLKTIQHGHLVELARLTEPSRLARAVDNANSAWRDVSDQIEQVFLRLEAVPYATQNIPRDGLSSADVREQAKEVAAFAPDREGYKAEFADFLAKLPPDSRKALEGLLGKIAEHGAGLLAAYTTKSDAWASQLEATELAQQRETEIRERAPHIQRLRDDVNARCYSNVSYSDAITFDREIDVRFAAAIDPSKGRVDCKELRAMQREFEGAEDLSDSARASLTELCAACIVEGSRINSGDLSGSLAQGLLSIRLNDPELSPAQRAAIRVSSFHESFASAVAQFNADHVGEPISPLLVSTARREISRLLDSESGQIREDLEARCRAFLHPENDLKIPKTDERVSREQRAFLSSQVDAFLREPQIVDLDFAEVSDLDSGEETLDATPDAASIDTALRQDRKVRLSNGVEVFFDLREDGPSKVEIYEAASRSRAEFSFGKAKAPTEVVAQLLPLREKLRSTALDEQLLQDAHALLVDLADGPAILAPKRLLRKQAYFGPGGPKDGGLRSDEIKPLDALSILGTTREIRFAVEKTLKKGEAKPTLLSSWSAVTVNRDLSGVYVTLSSNEHMLPGKLAADLPRPSAPAIVQVKIGDAAMGADAFNKRMNELFSGMDLSLLERGTQGSGVGAGKLMERLIEMGPVTKLERVSLSNVGPMKINLAPGARVDLTLLNSKIELTGVAGGTPAVTIDGLRAGRGSQVKFEGLEGSDVHGMVSSNDSYLTGSLSGSKFTASYFDGYSAKDLGLSDISWVRGDWPKGFNFPPRHAKLSAVG
ncbi:MAG: hypothetical protein J0M12_13740 [Deltaproteobacteria bacterium]|nr:hypothetical protein [Deltaproteobacteria bacterium]